MVFNIRYRNYGRSQHFRHVPWQGILVMLYLTSTSIIMRNVFRVIQYAMGQDGYPLTHEWTVYVMDGTLMLFTMVAFAWKYPSQLYVEQNTETSFELIESRNSTAHLDDVRTRYYARR